MKRILHYGLSENTGGIETYIKMLHEGIHEQGYHFDFLIFNEVRPAYYDYFKAKGSNFYSVTSRKKNPIKNASDLRNLLRNHDFDLLHCHMNTLSYLAPVLAASSSQVPVVIQSHSSSSATNRLTKFLHDANRRRLPKNNLMQVAVSDYAGKWLFKDTDFQVINNGIKVDKFKFDLQKRKEIREEFALYEEEYLIAHVGIFREVKNHEFILKSFYKFHKRVGNSRLLLVGEGQGMENMQRLAKKLHLEEVVIFAGLRNDVADIYSGSDLFVLPSLYEGFPITAIEAQASGVDMLISDTITDEVVISDNCYKLPIHDDRAEETWVNKMVELYQSNEPKNRFLAYQKVAEAKLTHEDTIHSIEKTYDKVLADSKLREGKVEKDIAIWPHP